MVTRLISTEATIIQVRQKKKTKNLRFLYVFLWVQSEADSEIRSHTSTVDGGAKVGKLWDQEGKEASWDIKQVTPDSNRGWSFWGTPDNGGEQEPPNGGEGMGVFTPASFRE